jgi:hypothetical protein
MPNHCDSLAGPIEESEEKYTSTKPENDQHRIDKANQICPITFCFLPM